MLKVMLKILKHCFSFKGRIRRREYALSLVITTVYYFLFYHYTKCFDINIRYYNAIFCLILTAVLVAFFYLAQTAKRLHDLGCNEWWMITPLSCIYNITKYSEPASIILLFFQLCLVFKDGQRRSNQYGDNPKGITIN